MDLLDSMKVYVLTIEKGSLSAAAEVCGMSATMAGNHVRALEQRLGMQLMHRTTRRQHVTAFGADYYARCKEILRLVAETDAQAQSMRLAPAGTLRVSAPVTFGTEALTPALSAASTTARSSQSSGRCATTWMPASAGESVTWAGSSEVKRSWNSLRRSA